MLIFMPSFMRLTITLLCVLFLASPENCTSQIKPGADMTGEYLPLIRGKNVAVFANPTSTIGNTHLVDSLVKLGIRIRVIFGPEHGFRGEASAGEKVSSFIDRKTGIEVVSLFGAKEQPSPEDLKDIDVMIFDLQDVGVRFYTYISSLQKYLEAAIENDKPLIILDRPNPNGFYVDGPVLQPSFKSFVGMQPVPVVYGMTIGEYAKMLIGERWLSDKANRQYDLLTAHNSGKKHFHLTVIKNKNYNHRSKYVLPVKPSPNLPDIQSIYLYPSTCFFEGTTLSEGRGTDKPFQVFGAPTLPDTLYAFTPKSRPGAVSSKHYNEVCYGWNLSGTPKEVLKEVNNRVQLKWLIEAYRLFPQKDSFFIVPKSGDMSKSFFTKLAGNDQLWKQIRDGVSEESIRESWQPQLDAFKKIRKKYLLYKDFE